MLMAKVRQVTGSDVPTALFFSKPTIAGLAAAIEELAPDEPLVADTILSARFSGAALAAGVPCAPNQQRLLRHGNLAASSPEMHLAEAVGLQGEIDPAALEAALAAVAKRHDALRTRFVPQEKGGFAQAVLPPDAEAAAVRLSRSVLPPPVEVGAALQRRAAAPFNLLGMTMLWRAVLYSGGGGGGGQHVLLLVAHKAVCDRWSLALMLAETEAAYLAQRSGPEAELPPPQLQLADVAAWQRQQLADGAWAAEQAFWQQQLAYAPLLLELPTDRPRSLLLGGRSGCVEAASAEGLAARLEALAASSNATLFMVVLAAWKVRHDLCDCVMGLLTCHHEGVHTFPQQRSHRRARQTPGTGD